MQPIPYLSGPRGGSVTLANIFATMGGEDTVTAFATGGQTNATALSAAVANHRVTVCATAGDSVKLPAATVGQQHFVRNDGAAVMQVFGQATETINGVASATGVSQGINQGIWYVCTTTGQWTSSETPLIREAANTLAQRNGTNSQVLNIYGTFTDTANYRRGVISDVGGDFVISNAALGTGVATLGNIRIVPAAGKTLRIGSAAADRWSVDTVGNFTTMVDNAYDIGASGATRPKNLYLSASIKQIGGITTSGVVGSPAIVATGRLAAQTAAQASVSTFTVGAADASFEVSANVLITTATTHSFTVTCAYTDEGNTARTTTFNFSTVAGVISNAAITNVAGAVPYEGVPIHIRCKAATAITIATTGTFTTVTYNVEGIIKQTA